MPPLLRSLLLVPLVLLFARCDSGNADRGPIDIASQAPVIPVPDAAGFVLEDHAGAVVIVNFWATWCGPCRVEIPALVELRRQYTPEELIVVGISPMEMVPEEQVGDHLADYIKRAGINYPIYFDATQDVTRRFDAMAPFLHVGIPATLIFDRQGQLVKRHLGVPQKEGRLDPHGVLRDDVEALLGDS